MDFFAIKYRIGVAVTVCTCLMVFASCVDELEVGTKVSDTVSFAPVLSNQADEISTRSTEDEGIKCESYPFEDIWLITSSEDSIASASFDSRSTTRGEEITEDNFYDSFIVYAYQTNVGGTTTYMSGERVSKAGSGWETSSKHYWPGKDYKMTFYAYAPAKITDGEAGREVEVSVSEDNTPQISYTVPKDASEQKDLLIANKIKTGGGEEGARVELADNVLGNYGLPVNLHFYHALTAVKVKAIGELAGHIKKVTISGVKGSGTHVFGSREWTTTGDDVSYSYELTDEDQSQNPDDDGYISLVDGEATFMMLPQSLGESATLEIVFSDGKSLSGSIANMGAWEIGHTVTYRVSPTAASWIYVLNVSGSAQAGEDDSNPEKEEFKDAENEITLNYITEEGAYFKVASYCYLSADPTLTKPVKWSAELSDGSTQVPDNIIPSGYELDDKFKTLSASEWMTSGWDEDNDGNNDGNNGSTYTISGDGGKEAEQRYVNFYPQIVVTSDDADWKLRKAESKGTKDDPIDLSKVNHPTDNTKVNTANCYVVGAPGYYKFPVVYGNAIKGGLINEASFSFSGSGSYLTNFTDYKGEAISTTNYYAKDAADAVLVWQDGYALVKDISFNSSEDTYGTISFYVNPYNIQAGNAVIAVRDKDKNIMWSWHIFVTSNWIDMESQQLGNRTDSRDMTINQAFSGGNVSAVMYQGDIGMEMFDDQSPKIYCAPIDLGYSEPKTKYYLERTGTLTFTQEEANADGNKRTASLAVKQSSHSINYPYPTMNFYQNGRKDPRIGYSNPENGTLKHAFYGPDGYTLELVEGKQTIKEAISFPYKYSSSSVGWADKTYYNLWNNNSGIASSNGYAMTKTVYDPCPPGYMVPPGDFFKTFTNGATADESARIYGVDCNDDDNLWTYFNNIDLNGFLYGTTVYGYDYYFIYEKKDTREKADYGAGGHAVNAGQKDEPYRTDEKTVWLCPSGFRSAAGESSNFHVIYRWSSCVEKVEKNEIGNTYDVAHALYLGWLGTYDYDKKKVEDGETRVANYKHEFTTGNALAVRPVREPD